MINSNCQRSLLSTAEGLFDTGADFFFELVSSSSPISISEMTSNEDIRPQGRGIIRNGGTLGLVLAASIPARRKLEIYIPNFFFRGRGIVLDYWQRKWVAHSPQLVGIDLLAESAIRWLPTGLKYTKKTLDRANEDVWML